LNKKILWILVVVIILFIIVLIFNKGERGSFEEVILNEYKEKKFHDITIQNITSSIRCGKNHYYEITNGELTIESIERIFNSMESNN